MARLGVPEPENRYELFLFVFFSNLLSHQLQMKKRPKTFFHPSVIGLTQVWGWENNHYLSSSTQTKNLTVRTLPVSEEAKKLNLMSLHETFCTIFTQKPSQHSDYNPTVTLFFFLAYHWGLLKSHLFFVIKNTHKAKLLSSSKQTHTHANI